MKYKQGWAQIKIANLSKLLKQLSEFHHCTARRIDDACETCGDLNEWETNPIKFSDEIATLWNAVYSEPECI